MKYVGLEKEISLVIIIHYERIPTHHYQNSEHNHTVLFVCGSLKIPAIWVVKNHVYFRVVAEKKEKQVTIEFCLFF